VELAQGVPVHGSGDGGIGRADGDGVSRVVKRALHLTISSNKIKFYDVHE
jgi:hypothetical protein